MMRKAISALGTSVYQETTYCWEGQCCTTPFMAEATVRLFQPDQLLVLLTPAAAQKTYPALQQRLAGVVPLQPLSIPDGHAEQELWQVFGVLAEAIEPGDQLIFDITTGFRSLPMLALLAANFVRTVRQATVERMIYGAFEARHAGQTPIFDLTPFLALLDWTTATDTLLRYGRADDLAEQVRQTPASSQPFPPGQARQLANQLAALTSALQTVRPAEVMESAAQLERRLEALEPHRVAEPQVAPFSLLLDRIATEYTPLALDQPRSSHQGAAVLQRKLRMIRWYLDKAMPVQAMTLAREWLVSLVVVRRGQALFAYQARTEAEQWLNDKPEAPVLDAVMPDRVVVRQIWKETIQLRNDLAHTGMRRSAARAATVIRNAEGIYVQLQGLAG
ncbi:TIGR02221 family CRISPR-associated protein [Candidatus Chloroploca sp. Khr17]|uniref:TIGR02221 family CRISPR-associated protein n=1 Tax=Candidatus Chloroploca sp. Khr17 TaxID=2496869 RepID=UPI00101C6A49|nr:TIGR02221 family CRISPR-associated protein [Candidatus Chloroploca sp. Khr17]